MQFSLVTVEQPFQCWQHKPRSEEAEKARSRQGEDQVVMDEQTGLHNANVYVCTGTKFWISIETNFIGINYVEQTKIAQIRGMLVSLPTTLKRSEWTLNHAIQLSINYKRLPLANVHTIDWV